MANSISTAGMSRKEWLEFRTKGIGGSDVAAILGLSPWNTPFSVWAKKTGRVPVEGEENEFMHWGTIMEPILAREFEQVTGKKVRRQNKTFYVPEYPFLRANIDRDVIGEDGILEIKTATEYKSSEWADDNVPVPYQLQVQHYMYVLDRPYCYFAYLVGGHSFGYKRVERDQDAIDIIEPQLIAWWQKHVVEDVPPEVDGEDATTAALRAMYPEDDGEVIALEDRFDTLLENREQLQASIKDTKNAVTSIDNELRAAIGEATAGDARSWLVTNKLNKKGTRTLRIKRKKED